MISECPVLILVVIKGVPQGSISGPLFFTVYINNTVSSLNSCQVHLYADDAILGCIADSVAIEKLSFNALQDALNNLKLVLNANKFRLFTRARYIDYNSMHICTANGSNIARVAEYKHLYTILSANCVKTLASFTETEPASQ